MLSLIISILIMGNVSFNSNHSGVVQKERVITNEKDIAKGKKIYQKICWTCHGVTGAGDGPGGAALKPLPTDLRSAQIQSLSNEELFKKISVGKGSMPAYEDMLSETQRMQLVKYIKTIQ